MVQLAEWTPQFEAAGVAVAAMSYDSIEVLEGFHASSELPYPLLRDVDAAHVKAYGVLNEGYEPGHRGYGIPHPGAFLIDADGVIRAKFAVPGYRQRPPFEDMRQAIDSLPVAGVSTPAPVPETAAAPGR